MQTTYIINIRMRNPFAAHSLKTKNVNRISPPSVPLSIASCILFTIKSKTSSFWESRFSYRDFQLVNLKSINALNIQSRTRDCMFFFHVNRSISMLLAKKTFALFACFAVKRSLVNRSLTNNYQQTIKNK